MVGKLSLKEIGVEGIGEGGEDSEGGVFDSVFERLHRWQYAKVLSVTKPHLWHNQLFVDSVISSRSRELSKSATSFPFS